MLREFLNFIKSFKKRFAVCYVVVLAANIFGTFPFLSVQLFALSMFFVSSVFFLPVAFSFFVSVVKQFSMHRSRVKIPLSLEIAEFAKRAGVTIKELAIVKANNAYVMGRSLVLGTELIEKLSYDERQAVVAHELGHVKRRHMIIKGVFLGFFWAFLLWSWSNFRLPILFSELVTQIILIVVLNIAGFAFMLLVLIPINWWAELDADKLAAKLVGKEHIKSALLKLVDVDKLDEPSETHPSVAERIRHIDKLRV